jgi:hypothetical protein
LESSSNEEDIDEEALHMVFIKEDEDFLGNSLDEE